MDKFPKGFLWGAATSAHQVEGNNYNDWTQWEKINSERLSKKSGGKYPPENYISGRAVDHYNRYEEDFDLAKEMGHNAHRFSIEWSRIEPEEGEFNEKEIEHYREVLKALRKRGIEPFVTLWHWTMPIWFIKKGAFKKRGNIKYFTRFCEKMAEEFKNDVKFWITLNEPDIYSLNSYFRGLWPPQKKSIINYIKVVLNLIQAHRAVFDAINFIKPEAQIGIAKNNTYFEGWVAPVLNWFWNSWFLNKIISKQDFIGINYYFHNRIKGFKFNQNGNEWVSDMDWEIYPEGIYHVLTDLKKYQKPIYILENGVADHLDVNRKKFIIEHLKWIHKSISEGIDVRGYLHWSLLDNFEWDKGFWPRFGLVEIDYKTLERKPRPSSITYSEIAKTNQINENTGRKEVE